MSVDHEVIRANSGALTAAQRRRLRAEIARMLPGLLAGRLAVAAGRRGRGRADSARVPDSRAAREAEELARAELSTPVLAHSYRTYLFGKALAGLDNATYDDEVAYIACLLHDLNLGTPTANRCFAVVGGERAAAFALGAGLAPERADAVGAAVAAHITPGVAADTGDPGGFVSAGAAVDVIGARIAELDRGWLGEVLAEHPRHNWKKVAIAALRAEAAAVPRGRTALLLATGFVPTIRLAPFPE
ncbi:phosphohydrolase [Nocardia asteroides]|uniref:phosphohydrolase n=1 Tax=Nocardia asteroides TaxID=1824 RepID=UPI001E44D571|nr:phosphohydrolase [Nocardia asteroides]UGT59084.1 phosphohydrolase [Nocardia asteroides]